MFGTILFEDIPILVSGRHVEDIVWVVHDMAVLVMLAIGCEYLDTASCMRRVDVARPKRKVQDLVADLWREWGIVDLLGIIKVPSIAMDGIGNRGDGSLMR